MKKTLSLGLALLVSISLAGTVYASEGGLYHTADHGLTSTAPEAWNQCGAPDEISDEVTAGPQAPRDIDSRVGTNATQFTLANPTKKMNMCNIHYHWNAEHKSAAYSTEVITDDTHNGWAVVEPASLDPEYRAAHDISNLLEPVEGQTIHEIGVIPGDTVEIHWVNTSCDVGNFEDLDPSKGLGNCMTDVCANPQLRVIAQIFTVVEGGRHTVKSMEEPMEHDDATVVYTGSTTGPTFNNDNCSPYQVTWDVKKTAAKIDAHTLAHWSHEMGEHAHGVRELVTRDNLLSPIAGSREHR